MKFSDLFDDKPTKKYKSAKTIINENVRHLITDDVIERAITDVINDSELENLLYPSLYMELIETLSTDNIYELGILLSVDNNDSLSNYERILSIQDKIEEAFSDHNLYELRQESELFNYISRECLKDLLQNEINDIWNHQDDTMKIYRIIDSPLPPDKFLEYLKTTNQNVGIYWSYRLDAVDTHNSGQYQYNYIFETEIQNTDINLQTTLYLRTVMPEENEIRVIEDTPIKIHNIYYFDKKNESSGSQKKPTKLDISSIINKTFNA